MPRIRCNYNDCQFVDDNYCSAAAIEIDPDAGCKTYKPSTENPTDDAWDEEEELEEWEELEEEEEDGLWDELDDDEDDETY